MAECKWCSKKGFFLKLTVNGVCEECNPIIVKSILENAEKYKTNIIALMYYITPKEGLTIFNELKYSLTLLQQYEVKGIPTINPLPSELLKKKIYGSLDESIDQIERGLINENNNLNKGILTLNCELYSNDCIELKGDFIFDENLDGFVQFCTDEPNPHIAKWCYYNKRVIEFSEDFNSGYYREYYTSNKLRREVPFIKEPNRKNLLADGTERLYYEDLNSYGKETYTLLEENYFKKGDKCGKWKKYSIDGGLIGEDDMDTISFPSDSNFYGMERKEYYPESGNLKLEEHKDWGKEYYENGSIKAEWSNKDFMHCGSYVGYHKNGHVEMTVNYIDGDRDGLMHKYFEDGKIRELWSYDKGNRIFVKKYFENGILKTEWLYDNDGKELSKKYYDRKGCFIK